MKRYEVKQIAMNWFGIYDNVKHEMVIESTRIGIESYKDLFEIK